MELMIVVTIVMKKDVVGYGYHVITYHTIPYHTIPYHTIPHHTTPYHTIPYHTTPHNTIPYHTIPHHTTPYHTIPYHTIPHNTIPYHTIPYHTIPYHTIPYIITYYTTLKKLQSCVKVWSPFFFSVDPCVNKTCNFYSECVKTKNNTALCECPTVCGEIWAPICASDNQTYPNECEMKVQSCKKQQHIEIVTQRECGKKIEYNILLFTLWMALSTV